MAERRRQARKVPSSVERFLKQLVVTYKAVALYPPQSSIPRESAARAVALLRHVLQSRPDVRFEVGKEGLLHQGRVVFPGQSAYQAFARELYHRNLAEMRFHAGADVSDILGALSLAQVPPDEIAEAGGFEAGLWERQVDAVTVTEVSARVYDAGAGPAEGAVSGEEWPPGPAEIEQLLLGAWARKGRDHVLLERVLSDPRAIGLYLAEAGGGGMRPSAAVAGRLDSLAHAVEESAPEKRAAMFRAIAEAVLGLEPDLRREVLRGRMLPEARNDEPVAQVLRQMSVDQVAAILVEGFASREETREGLARAIRNLVRIGPAGLDEVVNAVGAAMRGQGVPEDRLSGALEAITPSRLEVRERASRGGERPIESIVRLVDLTPAGHLLEHEDDPGLKALRAEVARGFTDGDVLMALVGLVALDAPLDAFGSVMSMVEDGTATLLERGEFEVAADVAEALTRVQAQGSLDDAQHGRVARTVGAMATVEQMAMLNHAFRVFPEGSVEHDACERLLAVLGGHVLEPMLEVLAGEQDMAARKSAVDLMSTIAGGFVEELGAHVGDERWYFVRNVVSILGRTRRPEVVPYLERTLRHRDARVRRETIRAAAGVRDRMADEMLIAALADEDAQNVSIAARYLGLGMVRGSVGALLQVARGEGYGNRDLGARVEAIEALGRIADPSVLPALEAMTGRRALLRGRGRELRTAALAAVTAIRGEKAEGGA
ncbi:MAG: HEAT repeat domain-containing protein [Coriobacteriia bacterium]|nr:HEAT repeat domain-containing protein [Coriobacteriia bacterium]